MNVSVVVIPRRDLVTPPQLARHAPRLDIFHPVEEGLFPALGDDLDFAGLDCFDRLLRQLRGIHIPLVGQPRLDHHPAAITKRRRDLTRFGVMLDLFALLGLRDMRDQVALFLQPLHNQFACAIHTVSLEAVQAEEFIGDQPVCRLTNIGIAIEHVEHVCCGKTGALAHLEVVEVVSRRNLYRAAAQLGIGVLVRHDGNSATGNRQDHMLADGVLVALVIGMHRNRHIGEHGFGPRGRDFDEVLSVVEGYTIRERIFEVPKTTRDCLLLDFQIGNRGLELRVPVHQPLVAIDQAVIVEVDEHLENGLGEMLVHGELLA